MGNKQPTATNKTYHLLYSQDISKSLPYFIIKPIDIIIEKESISCWNKPTDLFEINKITWIIYDIEEMYENLSTSV